MFPKFKQNIGPKIALLLVAVMALAPINVVHARVLFVNDVFPTDAETFRLGADDDASLENLTIQFGGTNTESIGWNAGTTNFDISDDVNITGGVTTSAGASLSGGTVNVNSSSNNATNINTGTSTGAVSIGGGSGTVAIDSTSWDISSAGVASGFTGVTSTGTVNFSGSGAFRMRETTDQTAENCATVGELILDTDSSTIYQCTATGTPGTWTSTAAGSTPDFEAVYTQDADKVLTTSNGAFTINTGTNTFAVTSGITNINDSNGTATTNIGTGTTTGTVTIGGTGAQSINIGTGAANKTVNVGSSNTTSTTSLLSGSGGLNMNVSNNQTTNINTGTSTGQVNLGGGSNCVNVNSNTWDVSCAGLITGLTGITSTGNINFVSGSTFRIPQAASDPGTCSEGQQYYNTTTDTVRLCTATNTWTSAGAAGTQYVFAYDTNTQSVNSAGVFQTVTYSNNGEIDGWTHTPGTGTFTASAGGTYMVNMTARIAKSGGANTTLSFRGAINGTEVTGSQAYGTAAASSGDTMSGNFIVTVNAGDVLTIEMTGGTTGAQLTPGGNGTTLPSTQLSIWRLK